jgi:hypothetical protein
MEIGFSAEPDEFATQSGDLSERRAVAPYRLDLPANDQFAIKER